MIVDELSVAGNERSARVRSRGGELRLRFRGPAELLAQADDASPYLALALPLAMRHGEELELDGEVSPRLLASCERIQEVYSAWHGELATVRVAATPAGSEGPPGERSVALFSRGVDSLFTALLERERLDGLLYCDGLEPMHDEGVRAEEIRLAGEAAATLDTQLVTAWTNARELSDPVFGNWEDMAGAGLAFVALSLGGGLRSAEVPSSDSLATLEPCGTSPLLDPLFSTGATTVEHGLTAEGRVAKVARIARERPELLRWLKVCYAENRADNCGRCGKCLLTMLALEAAGALEHADGFPDLVDLAAVEAQDIRGFQPRLEWSQAYHALAARGGHGPLRQAILRALEHSAAEQRAGRGPAARGLRADRSQAIHALFVAGRPWPPPAADDPAAGVVGLVRGLDRPGWRHRYAVGELPACEPVGELGALRSDGAPGGVPLHVLDDGRVVTPASPIPEPSPSAALALRWTLAPLSWRGDGPVRRRALCCLRRAARLGRRRGEEVEAPGGRPAGHLLPDDGPGRLPLYSAHHPVTGDQLLSTSRWEANDMGYVDVALLGWLEARAPVTGSLGTRRPELPWASRFGQWERGVTSHTTS